MLDPLAWFVPWQAAPGQFAGDSEIRKAAVKILSTVHPRLCGAYVSFCVSGPGAQSKMRCDALLTADDPVWQRLGLHSPEGDQIFETQPAT
jgi:hypothetical protein